MKNTKDATDLEAGADPQSDEGVGLAPQDELEALTENPLPAAL